MKNGTNTVIAGLTRNPLLIIAILCCQMSWAVDYTVQSPNAALSIKLHVSNGTQYEVYHGNTQLIAPSAIGLNLEGGQVIGAGTVASTETNAVDSTIDVVFGKNKTLNDLYNELIIHFNENYDLRVRAYNEGVAYRWETALTGDIIITTEALNFNFPGNPTVYFPEANNLEHWEKAYTVTPLNSISNNKYSIIPTLFSYTDTLYKIAITEANGIDYPQLYLQKSSTGVMRGYWAKYPKVIEKPDDIYNQHKALETYNYIANTNGTRTFPWRVFVVSNDDKSLLNNELVYLLAESNKIADTSWIVPGKTSWEWWHKAMLTPTGAADPANGIPKNGNDNLGFDLFKYYVDFAAANNIKYLTLDAGSDGGFVNRLCTYAKAKGVKILLWTWMSNVVDPGQENWMQQQKDRGIAGFKIDFVNRDDQLAMRWLYTAAERAANLGLVINFHGCPVPSGLNRTFPNVLNFEAVLGNEENFWRNGSGPDYHVSYPYIRSLAGPADYTPGSMRNKTKLQFYPIDKPNIVPMSQGTRTHELSMYVIFDQWLAYLCDAPTEYQKYPDILNFLSTVPSIWDKTVPLAGKLGEYILTAKKTGDEWYVGGMSSWVGRDIEVDFSFLKPNTSYTAAIIKDGRNNYPTEYICDTITVTSETRQTLTMTNGGGFVIRLVETGATDLPKVAVNQATTYVNRENKSLTVNANAAIQKISIYNVSGQKLLDKIFTDGKLTQHLSLSGFNNGIYIAKIQTESDLVSAKFFY
jgi:alpha-glucosidase